ncbi:AMP-binding protein [Sphingomonas desiccabilis]|nr:AMP-binding protein [Sphingomonas desiccabilis]MBB3911828.1 non-ribosomal peptide synthetase component F [Sphingomonas desiccabilis]
MSNPDQIVVVHGSGATTRAELERYADSIAARFRRAGVGRDNTVAVCLPRGLDQIAACLAVMKVGAACLPLSPQDPTEMLRFRLADCGVVLLVVQNERDPIAAVATVAGAAILRVAPELHGEPVAPPPAAPGSARRVAWIAPAPTLGGATCGAEITHANLMLLSDWMQSGCGIRPGDRICHMAEPGTSAAMLEVWPCLAAGATLVIMDDGIAADAAEMRRWLETEAVTGMVAGEDALDALAQAPLRKRARLRLVMTDMDRARRYPVDPRFRIVATYGHEECALVSTAHVVARNQRPGGPHIGKPVFGTTIHILDEEGRQVRRGEEGEMWISGAGVGRGYRNRPHLTAERFVPDPFGKDPAGMMFRTGRRARALLGGGIGRCNRAEVF